MRFLNVGINCEYGLFCSVILEVERVSIFPYRERNILIDTVELAQSKWNCKLLRNLGIFERNSPVALIQRPAFIQSYLMKI